MRICRLHLFVGCIATLLPNAVGAATVYSDGFDNGTSPFTASAYFTDASQQNGLIVKTTEGTTKFGDSITNDVSGTGYFLFNGTLDYGPPAGQNAFYISPAFAVTPNTNYTLSFYLTNANYGDPGPGNPIFAQIQPQINGVAIAATFSATGIWKTDGWELFSFPFNSGASTSEIVTLQDLQGNGASGGDFGIDNVLVATPEPSIALCWAVLLGAAGLARRRDRCRKAATR